MNMSDDPLCPISGELPEEERWNYLTHLCGLILSFVGCAFLLYSVGSSDNFSHFVCCSVYGTTLILLYAASTFYHRCSTLSRKKILKIADHSCIYLLIAGSYTPFALGPLYDKGGPEIFYVIWGMAAAGIIFKIYAIERFKTLSLCTYLAMGWLVAFNFPAMLEALPLSSTVWLMSGGLFYSVGTIFYARKILPYNHAVWHLFVLGGSLCHYCSIICI